MERASIQWSKTAKKQLAHIPRKARAGLMNKFDDLRQSDNPKAMFKRGVGPLSDYYRLCHLHHRAVYSVNSDQLPSGDCLHRIVVNFVITGKKAETDQQEIRRIVNKLISLGLDTEQPVECDISGID